MLDVPTSESSPPRVSRGPSRRRVLALLAAAVIVGAGAAFTRRSAILRWLATAPLGGERPGRLGDAAADTLDATVLALLDARVERTHYAEFFRWRAENVPGMRALFERFAVQLDSEARRHGARSFVAAPRAAQRAILDRYHRVRGRDRVVRSVFARDEQRFARYIVREVFRMFSRTDAWVLSGYPAWPGMPRAIASLRRDGSVS
jgi:hypothetical protein